MFAVSTPGKHWDRPSPCLTYRLWRAGLALASRRTFWNSPANVARWSFDPGWGWSARACEIVRSQASRFSEGSLTGSRSFLVGIFHKKYTGIVGCG